MALTLPPTIARVTGRKRRCVCVESPPGEFHHPLQRTRKSPAQKDRSRRGNWLPVDFRAAFPPGVLGPNHLFLFALRPLRPGSWSCDVSCERIRAKQTQASGPEADAAIETRLEPPTQQFEKVAGPVHTLFRLLALSVVAGIGYFSVHRPGAVHQPHRLFISPRSPGNGFLLPTFTGACAAVENPFETSPARDGKALPIF